MVAMMLPSLVPMLSALPPGRRHGQARRASVVLTARRRRGLLLRVDRVRNGRVSAGRCAGGRSRCGSRRWRAPSRSRSAWSSLIAGASPVHRVEGASPCLLPAMARARPYAAADAGTAWRHGLRLGLHCSHCCAGLTAILLVIGVMDLRAMAARGGSHHRSNVSRRPVSASRAPSASSSSGQGMLLIARAAGLGVIDCRSTPRRNPDLLLSSAMNPRLAVILILALAACTPPETSSIVDAASTPLRDLQRDSRQDPRRAA